MAKCDDRQPTFEQSLAQVESIVGAIEEGKIGLQEAIAQYEQGMKLIRRCREMLADAEAKVQQLQLTEDNRLIRTVAEVPADEKNGK
jgi:exodeoxyribonuclease VII small subunit